jgi:hypothetical protein
MLSCGLQIDNGRHPIYTKTVNSKFIDPKDVERVRDYNGKETPYPMGYLFSLREDLREELGIPQS